MFLLRIIQLLWQMKRFFWHFLLYVDGFTMKDHDDLLEIVPNNTQEHILKIAITLQLIAIIDCNKAQLKLIDCKENN